MHRSVHVEAVDARMLALMRCVLAFSAFAIIWIDPLEPRRLVGLTYGSLGLYCIYSAILALLAYRADWPPPARALHWIDVAFYAYLVALTEGTSSIFFQFFLFAILAASFSRGFREGFLVTGASVILFLTVGVLFAPAGDAFELNRTLIRGVYLFAFGYMIAYWGGYESLLKRRLRLLQEINSPWNPRLGVSHAVGSNLDRLREFYEGDSCILVLQRQSAPPAYYMQAASRQKPGAATIANPLTETAAQAQLRLPRTVAAYYYHDPAGSWSMKYRGFSAYDLEAQSRARLSYAECETLANLLDARALLTVPYAQRDGTMGRIFLTAAYGGFSHSDIDFLAQVSSTIATVVENMHMMEELITQAAEHERLTISRDLHDTSIQPYIGLKLSLEALQRAAGPDSPLAQPISELVAMAGMTLRALRDYAETLRERTPMGGEFLVAAVRRQAERLARFYGVEVEGTSKLSAQLQGRLAAEAFQMISEGLSNILRHTEAKRAFVSILCENSQLVLKIGDQVHSGARALEPFTPRSIHERSKALGGVARVDTQPDGYTVVQVTIPL
ncbi:MAG: hypothetical protein A3G81_29875 [Betaproteobacteria bacterium RIFCSPLOWO2_12_FULL_65_14]|nr:MAG: hypothetical protein A3G81_29875 [Betaproteobacteria bacterium RIFCSPLOWO2_12_FULL_65_14]